MFTQMRLIRVKTDKVDAMLIAQYGELKKIGLMATYTWTCSPRQAKK
jgi:hypothetical protein